ncbi:acyltransferase [Pseudalkalibacillus sp. Hm43]|uniref:acyltransferase n=1 Tax=Pseudalkalibacillus sp. Hm43 TaxID=3450742 RepID=UPI003F423ED0
MAAQTTRKFFEEIHFLRAFACLGVILVHVSASYDTWFIYMFNQLGRFGTPTFALISGFLLFHQVKYKGFDSQKFIKSRFTKIVVPFIVWSIFYFLLGLILWKSFPDLEVLIKRFLFGDSFYHLYFMVIVIQFYLFFPLMQLIRTKKAWMIALLVSFIVTFFCLYHKQIPIDGPVGTFVNDPIFLFKWIFYFIFGGFLAFYWEQILQFTKNKGLLILIIIAVYAFTIYEYHIVGAISSRRVSNLVNIPLLTIACIGLIPLLKQMKFLYNPLKVIGTFSMGIYLVHPFVLIILKELIPEGVWAAPESFPVITLMVLIISVAIVQAIRMLSFVQYIVPVPQMKPRRQEAIS